MNESLRLLEKIRQFADEARDRLEECHHNHGDVYRRLEKIGNIANTLITEARSEASAEKEEAA